MVCADFRSVMPSGPDLDHPGWRAATVSRIGHTWRGDPAPAAVETTARLVWTPDALWFGFECAYSELDVDPDPDPSTERHGLWERDVCEAFVQSPREPHAESYKEFEVAPTGQWFDVAIRRPRLEVDWGWNSGLRAFAGIDTDARVWRAVMAVPFSAFGGPPREGESWRINLYRIGRVGGLRQYLALSPTGTTTPNFHVPASFVPLEFRE